MTVVLLLVLIAAVTAGMILLAVRGRASGVHSLEDLQGRAQQVDLAAFRNLTDPAEEEFLRSQLPPRHFRRVQRQRLLASADYLHRVAHNASILLRIGTVAQHDPQPEIAAAGRELLAGALRMRVSAMLALALTYARVALPGARISALRVVDAYERLVDGVGHLSRLQRPADVARLAANL